MDMAARMAMNTDTMTPDAEQMLILQNWFSPAFPVGAFSYSGGLETAIARGDVYDRDSLAGWLRQTLLHGSIFMDAVFLRATMEGEDVNDLCLALCAGAERYQETTELGAAFGRVMRETQVIKLAAGLAYPVAVGMAARALALSREATVAAFLQGASMTLFPPPPIMVISCLLVSTSFFSCSIISPVRMIKSILSDCCPFSNTFILEFSSSTNR